MDRTTVHVGRDQGRALPVDPDRPDLDRSGRRQELGGHRPDRRPPVRRVLLGRTGRAIGRERVGRPGEAHEPTVEADEARLGEGRSEIDREHDGSRHR